MKSSLNKHCSQYLSHSLIALCGALALAFTGNASANNLANFTAVPPLSSEMESDRMIMLALSVDHQLFIKAYNDYDDLTGDGYPNFTYTHSEDYVGYFDSQLCYYQDPSPSAANRMFVPVDEAVNKYCDDVNHRGVGTWSGNFLNWATMTRIDLVRQVLYGGFRSTDSATETVLERAYLPQDAHSFAKHYDGSDIARLTPLSAPTASCIEGSEDYQACRMEKGYTFCNTTRPPPTERVSQEVTEPPLLRVVAGNYSLWDAGERYQCLTVQEIPEGVRENSPNAGNNYNDPEVSGIYAYDDVPPSATDYIVRVAVCGAGFLNSNTCVQYGEFAKPEGLLQEYGDEIQFGLLTGAYNSNKSYGVLRKNVGYFNFEEINAETGQFLKPTESIVRSIDALRIVDYDFDAGSNDTRGTYNRSGCGWGSDSGIQRGPSFPDGVCRNWGNPFSEILAETYRYFAGADEASVEDAGSNLPSGLTAANWSLPIAEDPDAQEAYACANRNVLGFNASVVSYDWQGFGELTPNTLDISETNRTLRELTRELGVAAGLHGQQYFIGGVDGNDNGICSPKTLTDLGQARGVCPEAPRLDGGYLGAGLAKYMREEHQVSTFGFTLAGALPKINVKAGANNVEIVPACRNRGASIAAGGNCSLVSFKVVSDDPILDGEGEEIGREGSYYVGWDDAEQGGDYDIDAGGLINFRLIGNQISVTTKLIYNGTQDHMDFGYVISGVQNSSVYFPSVIPANRQGPLSGLPVGVSTTSNEYCSPTDPTAPSCTITSVVAGSGWESQTITFTVDQSASAEFLESPLYYAAVYGSGVGEAGYGRVSNPRQLRERLGRVVRSILDKPSTGTGASVATSTLAGEGLILHSLYFPELELGDEKVNWVSTFNGLFIDQHGNIREDTDGDAKLTNADNIIVFYYDETAKATRFRRYEFNLNAENRRYVGEEIGNGNFTLDQVKTLWSAGDWLADQRQEGIVNNRNYGAVANNGASRYIFTAVPEDADAAPRHRDVMPFVANSFGPAATQGLGSDNSRLLDFDPDRTADLVNFVRGQEGIEGFRSRTLNEQRWLLGDIVHSTPAVVGRPSGIFGGARYADSSYNDFRTRYRNRRQVAYVGANDGMLHAFNAGFYDHNEGNIQYLNAPPDERAAEGIAEHELGAELWAYVPYNLLPHLKWLSDPAYPHVYYVDSKVHVFDVNIFPATGIEGDYPGGWGTILVVGMRFGGGEYNLNIDGEERTLRSAYIVMDVTNPENPPRLLGEVTHEDLGYTMGDVEVFKFRNIYGGEEKNDWFLVFGSGPDDLEKGSSSKTAKVFSLNLNQLVGENPQVQMVSVDTGVADSYVGGITVADWNGSFSDDMLYFGLVTTPREGPLGGGLMHAPLNPDSGQIGRPERLIQGNLGNVPVSRAPLAVSDSMGNYWIFGGSGRFLVQEDIVTINQNRYLGVRVNADGGEAPWLTGGSIPEDSLKNISGLTVRSNIDGSIVEVTDPNPGAENPRTPEDVEHEIRSEYSGWYKEFDSGELQFTRSSFFDRTLIINTFSPGVNVCEPRGVSYQYLLDMFTGLPQTNLRNILFSESFGGDGMAEVSDRRQADGILNDSTIIPGSDPRAATLTGDGTLDDRDVSLQPIPAVRRGWREISGDELP